jgi:hypothetical protein
MESGRVANEGKRNVCFHHTCMATASTHEEGNEKMLEKRENYIFTHTLAQQVEWMTNWWMFINFNGFFEI